MQSEDILKFRKVCDVLIKEKGYNKNKLVSESKLSWPTFQKVFKPGPEPAKVSASVLGIIQDFNKKHLTVLNYAGIKPVATAEAESSDRHKPDKADVDRLRSCNSNYKPEEKKDNEIEVKNPGLQDLIRSIQKLIPRGVAITITGQ